MLREILKNIPTSVRVRLKSLKDCPDHPIYHPEGDTYSHICIVTNRVNNHSKDKVNMLFVALLHDICKGDSGKLKTVKSGTYWQNVWHAQEAVILIQSDTNIQDWIIQNGGDISVICQLIYSHMTIKNFDKGRRGIKGGMGERKRNIYKEKRTLIWDRLMSFSQMDSMLTPFKCDIVKIELL